MKKTKSQTIVKILAIGLVVFSLGFSVYSFASAWVEPTTTPTGGNIAAPINTGTDAQTKQGTLSVYGLYLYGTLSPSTGNSPNAGYSHYGIYEEPGSWAYPYPDLMIEYHTGIKYIAYYGYGGHRFYTGYQSDASPNTLAFSVGEGDHNVRVYGDLYVGAAGGWMSALFGNVLRLDTWQGNHYSASDGREYATIFYDANNSGYYLDPNGTSRLNRLYYVDQAYIVDLRPQYMYDWNDSNYYIDMNSGSRFNYLGRNYGWNWTEYDWNDTNYYMDLNNVSILNDLRANIFYDKGNTGYYLDPNGTSRLNRLYYVDQAYIVDLRPQYMYDWNNTSYYMDFNNTSVLNVLYANQYNCMSDIRLKKDIQPIGDALGKVLTLRGVKFNWNDPEMGSGEQVGLIAQDVEKVLPEVVSKDSEGYLGIDYSKLSPLLIEAVKGLKAEKDREIKDLRQKIDILEADKKTKDEIINDLLKRVDGLESK